MKGVQYHDVFAVKGSQLYQHIVEDKDMKKAGASYRETLQRYNTLMLREYKEPNAKLPTL